MTPFVLLLGLQAAQAIPLATYEEHLAKGARKQLDVVMEASCRFNQAQRAVICDDVLKKAVREAQAFDDHVLADAEVRYLIGLAHRYLGDASSARASLEGSLALDPQHVAASYDLGELMLIAGDLAAAEKRFELVATHNPDDATQWLGHWRLAEVSAMRGDANGFETHLKQAIREGFSLRRIEGLPNWKAFYRDPELRDVIQKMIALYGTPETQRTLQPPQTETAP